jgi:hypothetical protein
MPRCIYCPGDARSREHWIPRGLGTFRGYTPLLERLCGACNERLGRELDEELMRTGLIGAERAYLGIEGRRGRPKVTAFHYKSMQADQPTRMMMPALGRDHELLAENYVDDTGRQFARPMRQVVLRLPDGRMAAVPFSRGWTAEQLRAAVASRDVQDGTLEEIYLEEDENGFDQEEPHMREVRALLTEVFGTFHAVAYGGGPGEETQNYLEMIAGINTLHIRGLAKAAFHYFLWASRVVRGDEPAFAPLRRFISEGVGNWSDFVQLDGPQFFPYLRDGYVPKRVSHFFYSELGRDHATAIVQFFVRPGSLPPPTRIRLSSSPLAIEGKVLSCHQASYFDEDADTAGPRWGADSN